MALNATNWTVWLTQPPVICALVLLAAYWIGELMVFLLSPPTGQAGAGAAHRSPQPAPDRKLVAVGGASDGWATQANAVPALPAPILSPTDKTALRRLRERVQAGEVAEGPTSTQRFKFARWLVQHGRFSEWGDAS